MPTKLSNKLILVTGATGKQGGAALRALREKGFSVRALTRDPNRPEAHRLVGRGTDVARGDLNDPASLTRAMEGVYGVYSVQTSLEGAETEVREGINLVDAARRSRISHFVYSSVAAADQKTGIPHFESKNRIEQHLQSSGVHYTILRPVFFMENWLGMRESIEQGVLRLPLEPATRLQMIAVDDIGAFVALAFERSGHWQDRAFDLAGDELPMSDMAQSFGRVIGREVRYEQTPWDQFEQAAGSDMTLMWRWFQDVGYHIDIAAVRQEYPRMTTFDRWLNTKWAGTVQARTRTGGGGA